MQPEIVQLARQGALSSLGAGFREMKTDIRKRLDTLRHSIAEATAYPGIDNPIPSDADKTQHGRKRNLDAGETAPGKKIRLDLVEPRQTVEPLRSRKRTHDDIPEGEAKLQKSSSPHRPTTE